MKWGKDPTHPLPSFRSEEVAFCWVLWYCIHYWGSWSI